MILDYALPIIGIVTAVLMFLNISRLEAEKASISFRTHLRAQAIERSQSFEIKGFAKHLVILAITMFGVSIFYLRQVWTAEAVYCVLITLAVKSIVVKGVNALTR